MNNLNYIIINEHLQSDELLLKRVDATKHIDSNEWQFALWQFISNWLDESKEYIEVKTSGSTGLPKIILHQKLKMRNSADMTGAFFNLKENQTAFCCMPVSSIGGMMMVVRALQLKMKLIVAKPESNPLKNINEQLDFVAMVPYQVASVLAEESDKLKLINCLIIGGGAIQKDLERKLLSNNTNAFHTFGMTETISHIAVRKIGQPVFNTLPNVEINTDENKRLIIDAPLLLEKPLLTNDLVKLKSNHQFEWLGRFDNAIETGGIKVIPELIESKLETIIPYRFFIHALPHSTLNNQLVLVIESLEFTISKEQLSQHLTKYEIPKQIFYLEKFEETASGKIMRNNTMQLIRL
jgi:O-succinylbenzoic acid--CoA ligase